MAAIETILRRLKDATPAAAVEGLARPQSRDAFELGRLCGIQQGLALAQQIVEEALKDEQSSEEGSTSKRAGRR
jgi:hypothetical protein